MTDRELLERAANAAGMDRMWFANNAPNSPMFFYQPNNPSSYGVWDPLTDDGDALRLAVRLQIPVFPYEDETSTGTAGVVAKNWGSKEANTRRAIVRAAAAMETP